MGMRLVVEQTLENVAEISVVGLKQAVGYMVVMSVVGPKLAVGYMD